MSDSDQDTPFQHTQRQPRPQNPKEREHTKKRKSQRRSGDFEAVEESSIVRNITLVLGGLSVVALVLGSWYFLKKPAPPADPPSASSSATESESTINDHLKLEVPESTLYDISPMTVARNFALSNDPEERLKWVRYPEVIKSRLAEYSEEVRSMPAQQVKKFRPIRSNGLQYLSFVVTLANGNQRFLCVIGTEEGPRVDWDTYARYGSASWEQILAGDASTAKVRVFQTRSTYYTKRYADREQWSSYALNSPDLELPIYGYVKRGSELDQKLKSGIASGAKRSVLTLNINANDIKYRQVEITEAHTFGWVEKIVN